MKEIPLTQGKVAVVSDHRYEYLSQWEWIAKYSNGKWYAIRREGEKIIWMHRVITQAPDGKEVDHRDSDGLNNQDHNLRVCSHAQNQYNRKRPVNNKSGFKGVSWIEQRRKWRARIQFNRQPIHIDYFDQAEAAARAYDTMARYLFGEFAKTNF